MIHRSCLHLALSIALMAAVGSLATPTAGAQSSAESSYAANIVVMVSGHAAVKRKGWTNFVPLTFGSNLREGDLLRLDMSSKLQVVCSDLKMLNVDATVTGDPCLASLPILKWADGSLLRPTRSASTDRSFPLVLSPRMTKLLSEHPLLRWTEAKGSTVYYLAVRGPELLWTKKVVSKTELLYPDDAPKLESGQQYKLIVAVDAEHSSEIEEANGLGFSVLPSKERKTVLAEQGQLEHLGLEEGPTQYLIARLYASHGLNAEAIQKLENDAKSFQVAATERLLGELYLRVQLPRQAESHYLKSLSLSQNEQDEEGQMQCHLALATIYLKALGNAGAVREHLEAAIAIADKVGDDRSIQEDRKKLAELR